MGSVKNRTMLILGMTLILIVIMIYGRNKGEVLRVSSHNALSLDLPIESDAGVKRKRSLEEREVTLTLRANNSC